MFTNIDDECKIDSIIKFEKRLDLSNKEIRFDFPYLMKSKKISYN